MFIYTYSENDLMKKLAHRRVVGVASEIAGGTTTFAKHAEEHYGAGTHRFSIQLRDIVTIVNSTTTSHPMKHVAERLYLVKSKQTLDTLLTCFQNEFGECFAENMSESRDVLQRLSTALRQTLGENCLAQTIFGDVCKDTSRLIVVEGVRRLADIDILSTLPNFTFIYVDATLEERFRRLQNRKQYEDEQGVTLKEFREICNQESERQIRALKEHADIVIDTNPLPEESGEECLARYHREISKILSE